MKVLLLDISSGSVSASVVELYNQRIPKVLSSAHLPISLSPFQDRKHLFSVILEALEHVLERVEKHAIKNIHIIFSSPWYKFETKVLTINHKTPIAITHKAVNGIIKDEEASFAKEVSLEGAKVVENRIVRTKLNGYYTDNPYGKKTKQAEITFFVSLIANDILEAVTRSIDSHFQNDNIDVSSFAFAAHTALGCLVPKTQDFVIMDVRGEMTDISVVREGSLYSSISFPYGKNGIIRAVAEATKDSLQGALSSLKLSIQGHGVSSLRYDLNKITESWKHAWFRSYKESVQKIMSDLAVPKTIFLMGDNDMEEFFEKILIDANYDITVYPLRRTYLHKYVEVGAKLYDPFLALETIFLNQISK